MPDRDLEQRLREHFRVEVDDGGPSASLLLSVSSIPEGTSTPILPGRRGLLLLLAAALLALIAGTTAAVGTGLLRLPWATERLGNTLALPAADLNGCSDPNAVGDRVAQLDSDDPIAGQQIAWPALRVYRDGSAYVGLGDPAGPTGALVRRDLTGPGLGLLLDALRDPRLPGCRSYWATGVGFIDLQVISPDAPYSIHVGSGPDTHVTSPDQATAVAALRARLRDPNLGLPDTAWADTAWEPYLPQRWQLTIDLQDPGAEGTSLFSVSLPDGSGLRDLTTDDPTARARGLDAALCGIVDTGTARTVVSALEDAIGDPQSGSWDFSDGSVYLPAVLPGDRDCFTAAAIAPTRTVFPTDACSILGPALAGTDGNSWETDRPDAWIWCGHAVLEDAHGQVLPDAATPQVCLSGGCPNAPNGSWSDVFLSPQPVAADQADAVAVALFDSTGLTREEIAGHPAFFNGCERANLDDNCELAVAISADPAFAVITWDGATQHNLEALAEVFAEQLSRHR